MSQQSLKISWALVDSVPLADSPDEDSPKLTTTEFSQLTSVNALLPELALRKQRITILLDATVIQSCKI